MDPAVKPRGDTAGFIGPRNNVLREELYSNSTKQSQEFVIIS
ncbi:MAG: hypothetical protein PG979_000489 [Rickettsia asembonensis]|nr:MAG: hypothetical protein PG979_000489 [Rickettsia asembonensis]